MRRCSIQFKIQFNSAIDRIQHRPTKFVSNLFIQNELIEIIRYYYLYTKILKK